MYTITQYEITRQSEVSNLCLKIHKHERNDTRGKRVQYSAGKVYPITRLFEVSNSLQI